MKVENFVIPTGVAKSGMTVRAVVQECLDRGVRAIPFCDEQDRITGLCSLKNIAKHALVPEYMVQAVNILGDDFRVLDEVQARIREILDEPIESYLYSKYWTVSSGMPLMKAIAVIEQNRTDYAFVVDDEQYQGVITVFEIAQGMLQTPIMPKHLDPDLLDDVPRAFAAVRMELGHLGARVRQMLTGIVPALLGDDRKTLADLARLEDETDVLHGEIIAYLGKISARTLSQEQTWEIIGLMEVTNDLENIADIIQVDMVTLADRFIREHVEPSAEGSAAMFDLASALASEFDAALTAVTQPDPALAAEILTDAGHIERRAETATTEELRRTVIEEPQRLYTYTRELEGIRNLTHIHRCIERLVRTALPDAATTAQA